MGMPDRSPNATQAFRVELAKIMPGYNWTVHHSSNPEMIAATGTQSSGFNRLSTLSVIRTDKNGEVSYEAKSAGSGTQAEWLRSNTDGTLARALRGPQEAYEWEASVFRSHAERLKLGRKAREAGNV